MDIVRRVSKNARGRDFVVGDIHGCFSLLEDHLREAGFDPQKDRLFCVGDLVDRGPESHRVLEFLDKSWFFTIRGDHEDVIPADIAHMNEAGKDAVRAEYEANGMSWLLGLSDTEQRVICEKFQALPLVMEIETDTGLVGLVHAEVPEHSTWAAFTGTLRSGDEEARMTALKSRVLNIKRFRGEEVHLGLSDMYRVFSGHSLATDGRRVAVTNSANWYNIDTGAVQGLTGGDGYFSTIPIEDFRLTLMNITG